MTTTELPAWATYTIDFGTNGTGMATYMADSGQALGGLRIMDLGDGKVALDAEAVTALQRQPEDADGGIDAEMQCWIQGGAWAVQSA